MLLLLVGCCRTPDPSQEVARLVEALALPPLKADEGAAYDAAQRLGDMGTKAFPELLKHVFDTRESIALASVIPANVGIACVIIIKDQVELGHAKMYLHLRLLTLDRALLRVWWSERSSRGIPELQEEALTFEVAVAEWEQKTEAVDFFRTLAREAHFCLSEDRIKQLREKASVSPFPQTTEGLVGALAEPTIGDYITRRIGSIRSFRAQRALDALGREAFPALLNALDHPEIGPRCLRILKMQVQDWVDYTQPSTARFEQLTRENARDWFSKRESKTMDELKLEIARHHLEVVQQASFEDPTEKTTYLRILQERIKSLYR